MQSSRKLVGGYMAAVVILLAGFGCADAQAPPQTNLADQAREVLQRTCYECHGGKETNKNLNVLDAESLFGKREGRPFLVPRDLEKSRLWKEVESGRMPEDGSPQAKVFTPADRELIKKWIADGAPLPERKIRTPIAELDVWRAVRKFLIGKPIEDRPRLRFFSFGSLYNNPRISDAELRLNRAALLKLVNSLTWEPRLVTLESVEPTGTILCLDLRDVGWIERNQWLEILNRYPYGLRYESKPGGAGAQADELNHEIEQVGLISGVDIPIVRGDWFVAEASRPPLYPILLDLPKNVLGLESRLGVDWKANFDQRKLLRAGFTESGVSQQPRLLEWHDRGDVDFYSISWDFGPRNPLGDFIRLPLGPRVDARFNSPAAEGGKGRGNLFVRHAFQHDGGEMIFTLPNGLHGYYLAKANGDRLDDPAPPEIVNDRSRFSGTTAVVNGISCFGCHRAGLIDNPPDEVRNAGVLDGQLVRPLQQIYPDPGTRSFEGRIEKHRQRYLAKLGEIFAPLLLVGKVEELPEPITTASSLYLRGLGPSDVASELYQPSSDDLPKTVTALVAKPELLRLGLGVLGKTPAGTIKREKWEVVSPISHFQETARAFQIGAPLLVRSKTAGVVVKNGKLLAGLELETAELATQLLELLDREGAGTMLMGGSKLAKQNAISFDLERTLTAVLDKRRKNVVVADGSTPPMEVQLDLRLVGLGRGVIYARVLGRQGETLAEFVRVAFPAAGTKLVAANPNGGANIPVTNAIGVELLLGPGEDLWGGMEVELVSPPPANGPLHIRWISKGGKPIEGFVPREFVKQL